MTRTSRVCRSPVLGLLLDVVLVAAFAALGRSSHSEPLSFPGLLATASPFLVGTGVGWLLVRLRSGGWPLDVGPGVTVWFSTVVVGMLLRVVVLRSFAWAFLAVAAGVLAVLLLGWRVLATRVGARPTGP